MQMAVILTKIKKLQKQICNSISIIEIKECSLRVRLLLFHCRELDDNLISSLPEGLNKLSHLQEL